MNCKICQIEIYVKVKTLGDYYCWPCHGIKMRRDEVIAQRRKDYFIESGVKGSEVGAEQRKGMLGD